MSADSAVSIALAVVISGTGAAFVTGMWNRKQLGANAAKIITDAAAGVVQTMTTERVDMLVRLDALERQVGSLLRQRSADREAAILHAAWDHLAIAHLQEHAVHLPDPPPLYAPDQREVR